MRLSIVLVLALGLAAEVAKADFSLGEPRNLGPMLNSSVWDSVPDISADGLSLYFASDRSGGSGSYDLWVATRTTMTDDWGAPVNLGATVNSSAWELDPSLSSDELSLYFMSTRPGGAGGRDTWVTTRAAKDGDWTTPVNLGPTVNSSYDDCCADISADGLSLFFWSNRPGGSGGQDLWVTTRTSVSDPWGIPVNLGPTVNSSAWDGGPSISSDGLSLFFFSERPGGSGGKDLWLTTRTSVSGPWGMPVNLGPTVNSPVDEYPPDISCDGSILYFSSYRTGGTGDADLWQVSINPIVDLNADGAVDDADMSIMVHYWGQDEPLSDIGPLPWGDGIVDVEDLIVLAERLEPGFELAAHWKLDESRGVIAQDSIGGSDATVVGGATWQSEGGVVDGALELDGVDDHVATDFVSDPKAGPVRIVCWVKTDVPGGVIVSQTPGTAFGSNWLATDPTDGTLMTEMMFPSPSLYSTALVADGQWHEVTTEWDGTYRRLWADNREVARDTLPLALPPLSWNGTLIIGAAATLEPDTFFSGLIDDIRIYNRAITP